MTPSAYLTLSYGQLAIAALLIAVNLILSLAFDLGLTRTLLIASLRTVVQLLAIGYVLEWLFAQNNPFLILTVGAIMTSIAGTAAVNRSPWRFPGAYVDALLSIFLAASLVTGLMVGPIVRVDPWYDPQYAIPLLGMVLGNALNGISLGLSRFLEGVLDRRDRIEALLCLGATRWEAARDVIRKAMTTGMTPMLNSMTVVGLVSLPGMMTGQILAGASPLDAVRYQIAIMFAIASAAALGTFGIVLLAFRRLLDPHYHCLRLERLTAKDRSTNGMR